MWNQKKEKNRTIIINQVWGVKLQRGYNAGKVMGDKFCGVHFIAIKSIKGLWIVEIKFYHRVGEELKPEINT